MIFERILVYSLYTPDSIYYRMAVAKSLPPSLGCLELQGKSFGSTPLSAVLLGHYVF